MPTESCLVLPEEPRRCVTTTQSLTSTLSASVLIVLLPRPMFSIAESNSSNGFIAESTSIQQALEPSHPSLGSRKPITDDPNSILKLIAFKYRCDEYSRLLPFARNYLPANVGLTVAVEIDSTISEVNLFLGDVRQHLAAKYARLDRSVEGFKENVYRCPEHSYEDGDLLCKTALFTSDVLYGDANEGHSSNTERSQRLHRAEKGASLGCRSIRSVCSTHTSRSCPKGSIGRQETTRIISYCGAASGFH